MIAVLAPGQGAQTPGMLAPWLELAGVAEQVARFSELAGMDLIRLGTTADADEIRDSAVTQPLIVTMGLVTAGQLRLPGATDGSAGGVESPGSVESAGSLESAGGVVLAGHSIGEVTAAAVAGVLTAEQAISFATRRGAAMAAACALTPTSMVAVVGGDPDEVVAAITSAGLTPANRNGSGQIVAAGAVEAIATLTENPPPRARVRPLQVAGAFHTSYMSPAEESLRAVAAQLQPSDPALTLLSNADGAVVGDGPTVLARLVGQVTRPVRWDRCLDTMRTLGVTGTIELAPAGTLTGIARRELPGVQLVAVKTPADLESAQRLLDEQAATPSGGPEAAPLAIGMSE
ncbi:ACP S-malonyltransferase [Jatrophihabitans sp.]|uniref:ACP S-malonyltransferase n=1 Tax=Jatrophihabitans sp. TaxID=1932789 RepID=UPI002BBD2DD5|nr:ACP S-malonyltransferase [Jatrophihabitans sp.]